MELFEATNAKHGKSGRHRRLALNTASAVALTAVLGPMFATGASAQDSSETVVVSASRITSAGFNAPTPTTVIGTKDIEDKAQVNLMNVLVQLPSMMGTYTQQAVASSSTIGGNFLNLRNLGSNRVLVLVDGQRWIGANSAGTVDISQIPQALIQRVDVVTGGASASWGSDAVSGVANFRLDNNFSGFKANINGGITTYGDNPTGQIQMAAGSDLFGNRAHVVFGADLTYDNGIRHNGNRPWYTAEKVIPRSIAATPAGAPQYIRSKGVYENQVSPGGIITAGPLKGITFGPGGTPSNFNYGSYAVDPFQIGGTPVDLGTDLDLASAYTRGSMYGRFSYNLTPNTALWISGSYSAINGHLVNAAHLQKIANLTIQCSNAYLPAQITAACATNNITNFQYGTSNEDVGPAASYNYRVMNRVAIGGSGEFDLFGSKWTWDAYAAHASNYIRSKNSGVTLTPLYNLSIDAIRGANGQIVCRSVAAQAAGCVPLNIIGTGVASPNAISWVFGSGRQPFSLRDQRQEAAALSFNSQPLSNWAGPVSVATGIEYREEATNVYAVDACGISNCGNPLLSSSGNNWFAGNSQLGGGNYHVVEGFVETGIPIIDNETWGQATLNLAAREEKYSTAGWITTWKVGFTWETPLEGLRLRGLQSRDVRAPGLNELFAPVAQGNNTVVDRFPPFAGSTFSVNNITGGNRALKPEKSATTQLGFVYQPSWFPGFSTSIDYWRIAIKGAVTDLTPQQTIDVCFQGNVEVCSNITRNAAGVITSMLTKQFNLGSLKTEGFDVEASYSVPLDDILPSSWLPETGGQFTFRALGTQISTFITDPGIPGAIVTHTVGQLQQAQSEQTPQHWRILGSQNLEFSNWGLTLTERWTSEGVIGRQNIECITGCPVPTVNNPTINNNYVPSTMYVDIGGRYAITDAFTAYFKVDNVSNADPTLAPVFNGRTNIAANGATGELLGRTYKIGLRIRY
jgi:iron complex outermembrane receptor protein